MSNKHSLIIGGTKGLGKTLARMLHEQGHALSIIARNKVVETYPTSEVTYFNADLLNESDYLPVLKNVVATKGKINNLIFLQRFKAEGDRWQGDLEVGLNATRKIIDNLRDSFAVEKNHYASIVMVSSIAGRFANTSQPLCYSLAKAGLNNMVKYYAYTLGSLGIRVNGVSPITFVKEESKKYYYEESTALNSLYQKMVPLGRMCTAEDVANVIAFLCSDQASFLSGQNIEVDGGLSVTSNETLARELVSV